MKRVRIDRAGGYERLRLEEAADVQPGPGEVRVAVDGIGVNFADCVVRMGLYASAKKYVGWPITPGFESAGVVDAVGAGVTDLSVGERVIALTRFGAYATRVVAPRHQVLRYPSAWTPSQAAGFPVAFLTAWYGLVHLAGVRPGQAVLVHSAAGGVGQALVQLAHVMGARSFGVVRGTHKVEAVRAIGSDAVVDKATEDWVAKARAFSPAGFDVVLDANGVETLAHSFDLLAPSGKLVIYGFHSMLRRGGSGRPDWLRLAWSYLRTPRFNPLELTETNRSVLAFNLSFLFEKTELLAEALATLMPLAEAGQIRPLSVEEFPLAQVADAQRALESGATVGKLVLRT